jgi:hypothetical protein
MNEPKLQCGEVHHEEADPDVNSHPGGVDKANHGDATNQAPQARTIHSSHSVNSRIASADNMTMTAPLTQTSARAGPRASAITHGDSNSIAPKIEMYTSRTASRVLRFILRSPASQQQLGSADAAQTVRRRTDSR